MLRPMPQEGSISQPILAADVVGTSPQPLLTSATEPVVSSGPTFQASETPAVVAASTTFVAEEIAFWPRAVSACGALDTLIAGDSQAVDTALLWG